MEEGLERKARNLYTAFNIDAVSEISLQIVAMGSNDPQETAPQQPHLYVDARVHGDPVKGCIYVAQQLFREVETQGLDSSDVEVLSQCYRHEDMTMMVDTNTNSATFGKEKPGYDCSFYFRCKAEIAEAFEPLGNPEGPIND